MCGIAGIFDPKQQRNHPLESLITRMTESLYHRGPDDQGIWKDDDQHIALGFRRLAIIDLSENGHQPMQSACGRYVIVFNGEIYNFREIKQELENSSLQDLIFRGHSDTEVLLYAIRQWGIEGALKKTNGMFALAVWDRKEKQLTLARDRIGKKPLYYGWNQGVFLFGSEIKAIRRFPNFDSPLDIGSLALYLRHNYVPAPRTIYQGLRKLSPGQMIVLHSQMAEDYPVPVPYWDACNMVKEAKSRPFSGNETEAEESLHSLLKEATNKRMISDVPLGAFLSGGVDSSLIVSLMQAQSPSAVRTFTIGFTEKAYSEAVYAKAIADHLGTEHTELYVSPQEAMDVIPLLPRLYDEPFSDSSQIPTFLVSSLARKSVTVALSGDGGDELFAGYDRYRWSKKLWGAMGWMPRLVRQGIGSSIRTLSPEMWNTLLGKVETWFPQDFKFARPGDRLQKFSETLGANSPEELYLQLVSHWKNPCALVGLPEEPKTVLTSPETWPHLDNFVERVMYLDLVTYLPDDILTKVDRASMGRSLELRNPLLDHRVVEFAWSLPLSMKLHEGRGKWILKKVLDRYVPREKIERPKMGFGVPIDSWLRGPLRDWAEALLSESSLHVHGLFQTKPIRKMWEEHVTGRQNRQYYLWDILMFQAWYLENRK